MLHNALSESVQLLDGLHPDFSPKLDFNILCPWIALGVNLHINALKGGLLAPVVVHCLCSSEWVV